MSFYIKKYSKQDYMNLIGKAIYKVLKDKSCVIIFFGSILTNKFNRSSDIDVAIYCRENLSLEEKIKLEEEIEKIPILRDVDIIDIKTIKNKKFLENILKGKIWKSSPEALKDLKKLIQNLEKL